MKTTTVGIDLAKNVFQIDVVHVRDRGAPPAAWQGPTEAKADRTGGSIDCRFWPDQLDHRTASHHPRFRLIPELENTSAAALLRQRWRKPAA